MKCFPSSLLATATLATLLVTQAAGQVLTLTGHAQPVAAPPAYHVRLDWQRAAPGAGGLVIWGRITNTGTAPLTYTRVTPTLVDRAGREVYRGGGYLTASPLLPGHSAEFRAFGADAPRFAGLRMLFHEAGHPVPVERPPAPAVAKKPAVPVKTAQPFQTARSFQ